MNPYALIVHWGFFGLLFLLSVCLTWLMWRYVNVMDIPSARSAHHKPIPRSGGVAIASTFGVGALIIYFFADVVRIDIGHMLAIVTCSLLVSGVSYWDDFTQRSFLAKFVAQLVCASAILSLGLVVKSIYLPFVGEVLMGWWAYLFTALWIVGLTNTVNFVDGLDGLVGGVALVAIGFLGYIAFSTDSRMVYALCYALGAGVAGFLVFNWSPARIFMGDVGSAFLGFVFACLAILGASLDHGHLSFYVVPLLLLHLIFDVFVTFVRRVISRESIIEPHRGHLYQLLHRMGWSHSAVASLYIMMTIAQGMAALLLVKLPAEDRVFVLLPFIAVYGIYAFVVLRMAQRRGLLPILA
jgi:UDP-GlcNAc:undecaprenyl-phosphate GlcNAc-1-phosphate transferase